MYVTSETSQKVLSISYSCIQSPTSSFENSCKLTSNKLERIKIREEGTSKLSPVLVFYFSSWISLRKLCKQFIFELKLIKILYGIIFFYKINKGHQKLKTQCPKSRKFFLVFYINFGPVWNWYISDLRLTFDTYLSMHMSFARLQPAPIISHQPVPPT